HFSFQLVRKLARSYTKIQSRRRARDFGNGPRTDPAFYGRNFGKRSEVDRAIALNGGHETRRDHVGFRADREVRSRIASGRALDVKEVMARRRREGLARYSWR